jgi:hypothetical protein
MTLRPVARRTGRWTSAAGRAWAGSSCATAGWAAAGWTGWTSRKWEDAQLAQKSGQLQPFLAVFPRDCMGQLASFGPT